MRITIVIILMSVYNFSARGQNDTTTIKIFHDAFSLIVSEDESRLAIINGNNYIEVFQIDPVKKLKTIKATRNTWLKSAYFSEDNSKLYFDYGMQLKTKMKVATIKTGEVKKINCTETVNGCSYQSLKYFRDSKLALKTRPIIFKREGINISMLQLN